MERRIDRAARARLVVAGVAAANVALLAVALVAGLAPVPKPPAHDFGVAASRKAAVVAAMGSEVYPLPREGIAGRDAAEEWRTASPARRAACMDDVLRGAGHSLIMSVCLKDGSW